ncbi:MAG: substrate-binding domain-containing protein [Planctomycetota bacterium]|jgi:ribose transport system substrate-binding protein
MRPGCLSWFALLAVSTVFVSGCSESTTPTTGSGTAELGTAGTPLQTDSRGTIGFSALELKNPFFKIIADSITEEAEANGFSVVVNDAARDVSEQSKHIDAYIAQGVTAIVLNPADRLAIGPAIRKANDAGIPVFTCDLQCSAEDAKIAGHIGTDNFQGGRLAGDAMIEALGEDGGQVLILHFKQANSCVLRVQGFREMIDAHNTERDSGKIEVVAELEGGGLQDEGFRATSDALQAHPDLKGIFAINDPSALGAWTALKQANKTDAITIVGFDGQLEGKQAILEGKIYADPIQFPKKMGAVSVQNIIKYLDGEEYEQTQLIPTELYRKADAEADPDLSGAATGGEAAAAE